MTRRNEPDKYGSSQWDQVLQKRAEQLGRDLDKEYLADCRGFTILVTFETRKKPTYSSTNSQNGYDKLCKLVMGARDLLYPGGRHYLSLSVHTDRQY